MMTTEDSNEASVSMVSQELEEEAGVNNNIELVSEDEEAGVNNNIELVSDDEEAPGVLTYSCTLGHNVPCVIQAVAGDEEDSPSCNTTQQVELEDLITNIHDDGDDDIVAEPLTSKFVVNFSKDNSSEPEPVTGALKDSDEPILTAEEKEEEKQEPTQQVKEEDALLENKQTDIVEKVSAKERIFNILFGCFKSRKSNKSSWWYIMFYVILSECYV